MGTVDTRRRRVGVLPCPQRNMRYVYFTHEEWAVRIRDRRELVLQRDLYREEVARLRERVRELEQGQGGG